MKIVIKMKISSGCYRSIDVLQSLSSEGILIECRGAAGIDDTRRVHGVVESILACQKTFWAGPMIESHKVGRVWSLATRFLAAPMIECVMS